MKQGLSLFNLTIVISLITGALFLLFMCTATHDRYLQFGLLGFLIGASMPWLLYLSGWFVSKGFQRTAFPDHSQWLVNQLKKILNTSFSDDQEKTVLEVTGTLLMVVIGLILAGAAFAIVVGLVYIAGSFRW